MEFIIIYCPQLNNIIQTVDPPMSSPAANPHPRPLKAPPTPSCDPRITPLIKASKYISDDNKFTNNRSSNKYYRT